MPHFWRSITAAILVCLAHPAAADTLAEWAQQFDKPEVQQKILNQIFSGQVGPLSAARLNKETGIYLFPKNDSWVRLGPSGVYREKTATSPAYLVVSCLFYYHFDKPPVTAASYLFRDPTQRPEAISGGYAGQETVQGVDLPNLKKKFVVLVDVFGQGTAMQMNVSVVFLNDASQIRYVWKSPASVRNFRLGFYSFNNQPEELVLQAIKSGGIEYSAYRWNGDRFDLDSSASESQIKALPADIWKYGSN